MTSLLQYIGSATNRWACAAILCSFQESILDGTDPGALYAHQISDIREEYENTPTNTLSRMHPFLDNGGWAQRAVYAAA